MNIQKRLREMQDRMRNAGWRIQWIPWQEPDKPEVNNSKPIALIGVLVFIGSIILFGYGQGSGSIISMSVGQLVIAAIGGLAIAMLGSVYTAVQIQADWERVEAQCIDREIAECSDPDGGSPSWAYRLLCTFRYKGLEYTVTPEASHLVSFNSERGVQKYLEERIQPDGRCQLWIDPQNPLHTIFHKKRWWL